MCGGDGAVSNMGTRMRGVGGGKGQHGKLIMRQGRLALHFGGIVKVLAGALMVLWVWWRRKMGRSGSRDGSSRVGGGK